MFHPPSLGAIFRTLAAHPAGAVMLRVQGPHGTGGLFLDAGRICWVALPETRRFLSSRLVEAGFAEAEVHRLVQLAQASKRPLGELLVEHGVLTAETFSSVLLDHSVESLAQLVSEPITSLSVHPRAPGTFALAFSFPAVSLLARVARRGLQFEAAPDAEPSADDLVALSMVRTEGTLLPLHCLTARVPGAHEALLLGQRAHVTLAVLGGGAASFRQGDQSWSVTGTADGFVVSAGRSPLSFSWMLSQHEVSLPPRKEVSL